MPFATPTPEAKVDTLCSFTIVAKFISGVNAIYFKFYAVVFFISFFLLLCERKLLGLIYVVYYLTSSKKRLLV